MQPNPNDRGRSLRGAVAGLALSFGLLHAPASAAQQATLVFRIDSGLDIPESMQYDPVRDVYYVSNIGSHATRPDNDGYISRILPDGTVDNLRFIAGGRDGVELHAPKGMHVEADTLWVTDVDRVRGFHAGTGRPLRSIDLSVAGAKFLNALDRGGDGALYVTDTGLDFEGPVFHPGPDRVYRIAADGAVTLALEDPALEGPNGILWDERAGHFLIVSLRGNGVFRWMPGRATAEVVSRRGGGGYDGVVRTGDGRIVVSSQDAEAVQELRPDGSFVDLVRGVASMGDIGVDTRRGRVLIPRLGEHVVEVWTLPEPGAGGNGHADTPPAGRATPSASATAPPEARAGLTLLADGLEVPWAMAFAPDGRIFLTERVGRVRVIDPSAGLLPHPWARLYPATGGDGGLQGIALAPDFERTGHVFVMGTFTGPDSTFESRILRLTDRQGVSRELTHVFGPIPVPGVHRGGGLAFGPDGMLYASVGDARDLSAPQDPASRRGAILRIRPDGSVPDDNPFPGSPVFALGLRNPQGLAFDAESGVLFATEHGPSDFPDENGWTGRDEVNAVRAGGNYGWPVVAGRSTDARFVAPIVEWTPALAPGGLAVTQAPDGPVLWVSGLRGRCLTRLELARASGAPGWTVATQERHLLGTLGRLRAIGASPSGALHLATSNRDDEDEPDAPADRLFRVDSDLTRVGRDPTRVGEADAAGSGSDCPVALPGGP